MICPSGLLSGSDIFSTISATMRLTATSSGVSTSRTRLPETSKTRTRIMAIGTFSSLQSGRSTQRRPAARHQNRHCLRVLAIGRAVRQLEDRLSDLNGEVSVVAQNSVDVFVGDVLHSSHSRRLAVDDLELVDFQIATKHGSVRVYTGVYSYLHDRSPTGATSR